MVFKEFAVLMVAAAIPLTKVRQLRHLGLSLLIQSGVPIPIVSKIARHASPALTGFATREQLESWWRSFGTITTWTLIPPINRPVVGGYDNHPPEWRSQHGPV